MLNPDDAEYLFSIVDDAEKDLSDVDVAEYAHVAESHVAEFA